MASVNNILSINFLPSIQAVMKASQSLALVDAIIMPEWENRYFSFNYFWNVEENEKMASMRNGEGSEYFILFSKYGVVGKILCNNMKNKDSIIGKVPEVFSSFKYEPAFKIEERSLLFWRQFLDQEWASSPSQDDSLLLLNFIAKGLDYYSNWARKYYDIDIDIEVLEDVFINHNVNNENLYRLNPNISKEIFLADLYEITGRSK